MSSHVFRATPAEQLKELKHGTVELIPEDELLKKFEDSYNSGKPLIVKFGADPSRPDIHVGHTVPIRKLRLLQDFGHEVNFLIGDFTAQIGDPTGRNKARQQLSADEVEKNARTYQDQIFKILDPQKTRIVRNSDWLNPIRLSKFLEILMTTTVGQMLAREDFAARFESSHPIYLHEFLYPILQGYDSVQMKADIELGGTDQKFNLLMGRWLQKCFQVPQQAVVILPLLEGLDGVNKMSKSQGNTIALTDTAQDMFGKVMSISDELMLRYYDLLSISSVNEIESIKMNLKKGELHPMAAKKKLAAEIVEQFHGAGTGIEEIKRFENLFSNHVSTSELELARVQVAADHQGRVNLAALMVEQGFVKSKSEARRLILQKAVKIDGQVALAEWLDVQLNQEFVLKSGKLHRVKVCVIRGLSSH